MTHNNGTFNSRSVLLAIKAQNDAIKVRVDSVKYVKALVYFKPEVIISHMAGKVLNVKWDRRDQLKTLGLIK